MNTLDTNEYKSVLIDRTFRLTADRLTLKCGIRADLKGCSCLADAIILYGTEACTQFCAIYRIIGAIRKLNPKSVMREISYAIKQSANVHKSLSDLIGAEIPSNDLHNGLVIAYLGMLFRSPDLSIYS